MNKKNNLGKISIPFSLLSIFLVSCGKNTPTIETTHQNLKTTFSLNVIPSANYIAQPDTQTIVIPESGCVVLNSSVSTNNNKKDLSFNNINLQSNVLEHFQLDNKTQTLCHLGILQPNEPDTAELVLNSDNESSETYKIEDDKHNLPTLSLNSFEQNNNFKVFNFSFEINNKKPKKYGEKVKEGDKLVCHGEPQCESRQSNPIIKNYSVFISLLVFSFCFSTFGFFFIASRCF
jgi:hypothetical protein